VRLVEGEEVVDDYRVVGEPGETYEPSPTITSFNAVLDRWELISVDNGKGFHDFGTGGREGGERKLNFLVDTGRILLAKGMRPTMARLTLARKIAAITLIVWKKGARFDANHLKQAA
jgi:hypothetical protein